jgi:hypothetical protein
VTYTTRKHGTYQYKGQYQTDSQRCLQYLSLGALQTLLSQRQATDFQSIHRWPAAIDVQMGWHDAAAWDTTLKNTTRKRHGTIGLVSVPARTRYSVVCGPNPQYAVPART